jgi:hypothetical protein
MGPPIVRNAFHPIVKKKHVVEHIGVVALTIAHESSVPQDHPVR